MALPENLFTRLTICPTYGRTFQVFAQAPCTFIGLTAFFVIPMLAIAIPVTVLGAPIITDTRTTSDYYAIFVAALVTYLAFYIVFATVAKGAMMQAVAEIYSGHSPNWWACIKKAFHRLFTLFCLSLIEVLVVFVAMIFPAGLAFAGKSNPESIALMILFVVVAVLCTAWIIFFWVSVFVAMPSIMVEKESAIGSIKRSYGLSTGYRCYIFGTTALLFLATFALLLIPVPGIKLVSIILYPIHAM